MDEKHNGRLPVPVRVIQDEWANVAQPESYPKILATCRSYSIGLNIIVQNIQRIKALYEKKWESIHCASGYNNVVVTGKAGFKTVGRPQYYSE